MLGHRAVVVVARGRCHRHLVQQPGQRGRVAVAAPDRPRRSAGRPRLDEQPEVEEVVELGEGEQRRRAVAAQRLLACQAERLQARQRLAHRRGGDGRAGRPARRWTSARRAPRRGPSPGRSTPRRRRRRAPAGSGPVRREAYSPSASYRISGPVWVRSAGMTPGSSLGPFEAVRDLHYDAPFPRMLPGAAEVRRPAGGATSPPRRARRSSRCANGSPPACASRSPPAAAASTTSRRCCARPASGCGRWAPSRSSYRPWGRTAAPPPRARSRCSRSLGRHRGVDGHADRGDDGHRRARPGRGRPDGAPRRQRRRPPTGSSRSTG